MTTIVRVKRQRGEDPVEALVLSCKRKKTENNLPETDSNMCKYILNFSGTVEEKDDNIATSTIQSSKSESKYSDLKSKEHVPDIKTKLRKDYKERSDDSRFTLLSCLRARQGYEEPTDVEDKADGQKNITIVDVSKDKNEDIPGTSESSYVYDLYSTNIEYGSDNDDLLMEHILSVQAIHTEPDYRFGEDCFDEVDPYEDDSNDENNWRNDYPDSDIYADEDDDEDEEEEEGSEGEDVYYEDVENDYLSVQLQKFHIDKRKDKSESSNDGEGSYLDYYNDSDDVKYYYDTSDTCDEYTCTSGDSQDEAD